MAGRRRSIGSSCSKELAKNGTSSTTESPAQNRRLATQDTGRYGRGPEIAMSTNKSRRSRGQARSAWIDIGIMAAKIEGQEQNARRIRSREMTGRRTFRAVVH